HVTHVISSSPCYGYVHRRDRHSVPTRRSSDLQSSGSVRRYRLRSNDTGGGRLGSQSSDELPDGEPRAHKRIEDQGSVGGIIEVPEGDHRSGGGELGSLRGDEGAVRECAVQGNAEEDRGGHREAAGPAEHPREGDRVGGERG